jgi:Protein of unknown function (DUF3237)
MKLPEDGLIDSLPPALRSVGLKHLLALRLQSVAPTVIGETPGAFRRVGFVTGGTFESAHEELNGRVLDGGNDWQTVRPDGTTTLDVRIVLETHGGQRIAMTYRGLRHGSADVLARLDRGEAVDPAEYYFRMAPFFETSSVELSWLNRIVTIGTGYRLPAGPVYNVFEVL